MTEEELMEKLRSEIFELSELTGQNIANIVLTAYRDIEG